MATIDDKVVAMSFESSKFEQGVAKSITALDKLKAALNFPNAGKALVEVGAASKAVDLGHIAKGVDDLVGKFTALKVAAVAVFVDIAKRAVDTGASLVKAFTIDPMKAGFKEYSTNLNAVQTILANTQASGATLKDVNAALDELNTYSDKTIYNFSQMARNIGTFTAAGVDLKTATASIKGIANLAALSGSNAEQASTAMYQLSQAISAGAVKLMDWNSVVNAGMGGTVFQRALAQTAEHMGKLKKGTVELVGPMKNVKIAGESFRNSLSTPGKDSWLTSDVLTTTLKMFTSDLTDAELRADGWNEAQIKAIQTQAKTAMLAATNVKTLTQVLDVAKETAGSGWAKTWQIVFGDFGEAKKTFTALSNTINSMIIDSARARNNLLADWKALGGRTVLIQSIKQAFEALSNVVKPIKQAFRDIFPAATGKMLFDLTMRFEEFSRALMPTPKTIANLRLTFQGLFAILDIGWQVVKGIGTVLKELFGTIGEGSGGFLEFTGNIGQWLVKLDEALKKGNRLHDFFVDLAHVISAPVKALMTFAGAVASVFEGIDFGGFSGEVDGATQALTPFGKILKAVGDAWTNFVDSFGGTDDIIQNVVDAIVSGIQGLGTALGQAASTMSFEPILAVIRTGLLGGIFLMLKNFFGKGSAINQLTKGFGGGILANISGSFGALKGSLVALQNNIKADTLKKIAIAVALLAASMVALSFIDPKRLSSSLSAMTVAFAELLGAMAILTKITSTKGFLAMPFITASMILLAGAIDILALAVMALSTLSWSELLKGLSGVAVSMGILVAAVKPLSASSSGMVRAGIGITALAVGMRILANAVEAFGRMDLKTLGKGLGSVAVGLGIMVAALTKVPETAMIRAGIAIGVMAVGLRLLAEAVEKFASMNLRELGKGLGAVAVSMGILVGSLALMKAGGMLKTSAALVIMAGALNLIAEAVIRMGGQSLQEIGKGLGGLAGGLILLGAAMYAMSGSIVGAVALGIAATSLALLVPALVLLGKQKWSSILTGLIGLAAALIIIGVAGTALTGAIPSLMGLGVALLLIGGAFALFGAGIFLVSAGISALAVALPTGVGVIIAAIIELEKAIPEIVKNLLLGLLEVVDMIAQVAPKFVDALVKIIEQLLEVIIRSSPKMAEAFTALLDAAIMVLQQNQAKIIQAGWDLLVALLQGIRNNIASVVTTVVGIITKFLGAIASKLGDIIRAGANILVSLIKGIVGGYATIVTTVAQIFVKFLGAIASNLGKIVTAGLSIITKLLGAIAQRLPDVVKAGVDVIVAVVRGIGQAGERIVTAARVAAGKFINTLAKQIVALADQVFTAMITLINGLATVIENRSGELRSAGVHLGVALIDGMTGGLISKAQGLYNTISGIMGKAMGLFHKIPGVHSPSTVTTDIGGYIIQGLVNGMDKNARNVYDSAIAVSNGVIKGFTDTLQIASPSKVMITLGKAVGEGFAVGIRGSTEDIKNAFKEMNSKLTEQMVSSRQIIASEQEKLDKLRASKKPDAAAIKEAQAVIKENQDLLARSTAGHILLTKALKDEKAELIGLANDYENIGKKLEKAKDELKGLQQEKAAYQQSLIDQYGADPILSEPMIEEIKSAREAIAQEVDKLSKLTSAPEKDPEAIAAANAAIIEAQAKFDALIAGKVLNAEGTAVDQLATYTQALANQTKAVGAYQATLDQLRKLGLDNVTYQKLLKEGPADQNFANQLLAGGKTAVRALNTLDKNLKTVSERLATTAAANLKDAGIKSKQGLINGLKQDQNKLIEEMENIARVMVKALKKELGIKSPSKVFMDLGVLSMEGMAQGISKGTAIVSDAAADAISAMKNTMRNISDIVMDEMNPNPVITPILDLTQVRSQAEELGALTTVVPITAAASYGQASLISSEQTAAQADQVAASGIGPSVKFEQNNYSPESLTEIEIYRQTKNQLSQLKSVLAIT